MTVVNIITQSSIQHKHKGQFGDEHIGQLAEPACELNQIISILKIVLKIYKLLISIC